VEKKTFGVMAILTASIMWAIEPILAKLSYQSSDFLQTSGIRALFVTLTAFLYILLSPKGTFKISPRQASPLFYIAVVGTLFADLIYFLALTTVPVLNAVLIGHMQPLFIVLIGFLLLPTEHLTRIDYMGILCMVLAGILVSSRTLTHLTHLHFGTPGDLFVLTATLAWATTAIIMKKHISGLHAGTITFYRFFIATGVLAFYLGTQDHFYISSYYQILLGIIVGLGTLLYYEGLKRIKAAQVSALELSTPFFAALLGFIILGEQVTSFQIIGILLLITGVSFFIKKEKTYL
jgi:drug/metabolite transporter (DMT)-like permease